MAEKNRYLWIRSVSFLSLRELIFALQRMKQGFRAKDINETALNLNSVITHKGNKPSATTLYHYRNILLHLGVFVRDGHLYSINNEDPLVANLFDSLQPGNPDLTVEERYAWGQLILRNHDCKNHFFDLFMTEKEYDLQQFVAQGQIVAWQVIESQQGRTILFYNTADQMKSMIIKSEDEIQAILYGIRYWARNELRIIDEFFLEDMGGVLFPINLEVTEEKYFINYLKNIVRKANTNWYTFSVRDLLLRFGPESRLPVNIIHKSILKLQRDYPEYVVFIPTSEGFATITAQSRVVEKYQLRSYLQDDEGRHISHFRIHKKLGEVKNDR